MNTTNDYRQDLKEKIIDYAMREFYKRGVKAVKMDEISQGLHVSKRTVYEIFGDKEEMLLVGMRSQQAKMRVALERFARTEHHNVIDIISYFYRLQMERNRQIEPVFFEEIHKYPRILEFLEESHQNERSQRVRFYKEGVKEGVFRKDINFDLLSEIGHITMEETMKRQLYKQFNMQTIFDNYFMILIRGICTDRGLGQLKIAMRKTYM